MNTLIQNWEDFEGAYLCESDKLSIFVLDHNSGKKRYLFALVGVVTEEESYEYIRHKESDRIRINKWEDLEKTILTDKSILWLYIKDPCLNKMVFADIYIHMSLTEDNPRYLLYFENWKDNIRK